MPYLKRTWTEATPINTANLQSIEDGIAARFQYRREVGGGDNWNAINQEGVYKVALLGTNAPVGAYTYGALVVFTDEATMVQQMYFPHDIDARPYTRIKYNATDWQPWVRLANATHSHTAADIGAVSNINGKTGTNITLTTSDIDDVAQGMPLNDIIEDLYGGKLSSAGGSISGDLTFSETKGPILNDLDTTKKYRLVVKSGQLYIQEI